MITFGFRNKMSGILRAVTAIAFGVVMVAFPGSSLKIIVQVAAAFLVASGLASAVFGIMNRRNGGLGLMITNAVVDIALGAVIFCFPVEVAGVIMFIIGLMLMIFGIFQISVLLSANRVMPMGLWSFVLPVMCAVGGALVVFHPFGLGEFITLVAGVALIVYGLSESVATWKMRKAMKEYEIRFPSSGGTRPEGISQEREVKDVDYEKVDK